MCDFERLKRLIRDFDLLGAECPKLGAQVNNKSRNANLPIHWAAVNGFETLVKLLIEHDSKTTDKNAQGETPLSSAIKNGHVAVVSLLSKTS